MHASEIEQIHRVRGLDREYPHRFAYFHLLNFTPSRKWGNVPYHEEMTELNQDDGGSPQASNRKAPHLSQSKNIQQPRGRMDSELLTGDYSFTILDDSLIT